MKSPTLPPRVAVIGCGPGGMFLCHTLETRMRKDLADPNKNPDNLVYPQVTVFERAPAPGGVWRENREYGSPDFVDNPEQKADAVAGVEPKEPEDEQEKEKTETTAARAYEASWTTRRKERMNLFGHIDQPPKEVHAQQLSHEEKKEEKEDAATTKVPVYEALWANHSKECMEFYDYTYEDHYGKGVPLPSYLPRTAILEYLTSRVTHNCPDIFDKYVQFETEVQNVTYDDTTKLFEVTTKRLPSGETTTGIFDKCVWAAGSNGKPKMPGSLLKAFDGFDGPVLHSSETNTCLKQIVENKRVLLIGGSYSSLDLTLMSIKLGASHVYINMRTADVYSACYTDDWPYGKAELVVDVTPVASNGKNVYFGEYDPMLGKVTEETPSVELTDIDTVVFCTGYSTNWDMLDDSVFGHCDAEELDEIRRDGVYLEAPKDWKMSENSMTKYVGDVKPASWLWAGACFGAMNIKDGVVHIPNPNFLMYTAENFQQHLVCIDVQSWTILAHIMGERTITQTDEEMYEENFQRLIKAMDTPLSRFWIDSNYTRAIRSLPGFPVPEGWREVVYGTWERFATQNLAKEMVIANYPVSFGSAEKLNEKAEQIVKNGCWDDHLFFSREDIKNDGLTYRDLKEQFSNDIQSIFTGAKAAPFKKPWMELDDAAHATELVDGEVE